MARVRPRVVAFDVVETLMSLEPLRDRFEDVGLPGELLERWFDRLLRDGMALTLAGDYEPFPRVADAALRTLTRGAITDDQVTHVLSGFAELPAHPDAEPAMRLLADHDVTMVCLSNGSADHQRDFLCRTDLDGYVDQVISVADVRSWKPPARVYHHALDRIATPLRRSRWWRCSAFDCHGAHRAGLTTGWASRLEGHYATIFAPSRRHRRRLGRRRHRTLALPRNDRHPQARVPSQVVRPYRAT